MVAAPAHQLKGVALTLYLSKRGVSEVRCLQSAATLQNQPVRAGRTRIGTLYHKRGPDDPPRWTEFFEGLIDLRPLRGSTVSGVLLIKVGDRRCAAAFGHGRHMLDQSQFEEDFGLRTTLNSIDADSVRSVDRYTLDAAGTHGREQSTGPAAIEEFSLDPEQDILRDIVGTPIDKKLGTRLGGRDSLTTVSHTTIRELVAQVELYVKQYRKRAYVDRFPWIDNVRYVREKGLVESLDKKMCQRLTDHTLDKLWLAVPEIVDWSKVGGFQYWSREDAETYEDLDIDGLLDNIRTTQEITAGYLRSRKLFCMDASLDFPVHKWSVYKCLYCEISIGRNLYLLNNGRWYQVDQDFVQTVDNFYRGVRQSKSIASLPDYDDDDEGEYNVRAAVESDGALACMDKKMVRYGGGHGQVEFCDLYDSGGVIIHVKRYGSSRALSHLFQQGLVSGEAFISDDAFRRAVNGKLPSSHKIEDPAEQPKAEEHEIAFVIITSKSGRLELPFFAKLSLRAAVKRLRAFRYTVTITPVRQVLEE